MGLFDKIKHAVFGDKGPLGGQFGGSVLAERKTDPAPGMTQNPSQPAPAARPAAPAPAAAPQPTAAAPRPQPVDVEALLTQKAAALGKPSNWRTSIVDLMILLGLDPSRENRTELARELGYTGNVQDSASMNIWLHKQVMQKLAQSGGAVPAELKD